ncbi:RICIN domain-containing protein [Streptomyces sp. NPDC002309]
MDLPQDSSNLTDLGSCRISSELLASEYEVIGDDGEDDTAGLQRAIDHIKEECSPKSNFNRLSLIELPAGRIDITKQIYVDASFLTIRGQGSGDGGTRLVFRPDLSTRYDKTINGRWDQDSMTAGTAPDIGNGGWIWPGRGLFRVQTREIATRYKDDWNLLPPLPGRKDLYEGSINQHWASGFKLAGAAGDENFSAREGAKVVRLDTKADMTKFKTGGYVWVGAANSKKFYAQQGITDPSMMEALHMRQEMFQISRLDTAAKTITLDRPLEWDLPVNSESDGSEPLTGSGTPYVSKVTPLKIVEGVGFEDFAFTQDMEGLPKIGGQETYSLTPAQAKNNYGNLAPEYAMHGIVFKWAANSWARGLKATMTGSHPIVTEVARNLQIERNSFDGSWNKGKGGNGYLRGSRVWDSLWAHNDIRNLRHFTFQWSASGNVAFRNDLDSDLNLHGGWEHNNLFEQNTVRVPYEHRSANCTANCGGEGGQVEPGTWYPIWWAAGPKAGKWAGSSGPQNVFYNNTLIKQATPGGPFEPYAPYGARAGTAFQFGSSDDDPRKFRHLSQNGQGIADWTERETLDYKGNGVATFDAGHRHSLFLRDTGGELPPRDPQTVYVNAATWNMAGASSQHAGDRYQTGVPGLHTRGHRNNDILALQEAGAPAARHYELEDEIPQSQYTKKMQNGTESTPPVKEYMLRTRRGEGGGYLYWLNTSVDDGTGSDGKINLAIWSRTSIPSSDIFVVPGKTYNGVHWGKARPALGVKYCGAVFFTWHGASEGGTDNVTMLLNIERRMAEAAPPGQPPLRWSVLGDYNMEKETRNQKQGLTDALGGLRDRFAIWDANQPTRPASGRKIDYAVTAGGTNGVRSLSGLGRVDHEWTLSDHHPVEYDFSYEVEDPDPRCTEEKPQRAKAPSKLKVNLKSASKTTSPYASTTSGSPYKGLKFRKVVRENQAAHDFQFQAASDHWGYYRVMHTMSRTYLGQEDGLADKPVILDGSDQGDSQLWQVFDMGDGSWILLNKATGQALTTLDRAEGEELVGRDLVDEFDPDQRWFFQDSGNEALDIDEIVTQAGSAMTVRDADPEEGTPVVLEPDGSDEEGEEFEPIYADMTEDSHCYYLVHKGLYVNSTATNPAVTEGNTLTLNKFRANDEGYLFCIPWADRHSQSSTLSQYDRRERNITVGGGPGGTLVLSSGGVPLWDWKALSS